MTARVDIWTDGACSGNPGPGGWGAILRWQNVEKEICGYEPQTTNNRMELTAAVKALETLKKSCVVAVHTDSQYLQKGVTEWIKGWKKKNWRTASGKEVKNVDLWLCLDAQVRRHEVSWLWVKGHADDVLNTRADLLARSAIHR